MSLAVTVAFLTPGQKVRASFRHHDKPIVGTVRTAQHHADVLGSSLFLDVPAGHMLRDHEGRPGWGLRWVEVLPADRTTREEDLERIDTLVDEYLSARAAWEQAPASEREGALQTVRDAYDAAVSAMDAPFEVA